MLNDTYTNEPIKENHTEASTSMISACMPISPIIFNCYLKMWGDSLKRIYVI